MSFVITMRISISHRFFSINFRHFRFKSLKFLPFSFTVEIHFVDDFFSSSFMLLHASFMFFFSHSLRCVCKFNLCQTKERKSFSCNFYMFLCLSRSLILRFTIVSLSRASHNDRFMQIVILRNEREKNYLESVIFLPAVLAVVVIFRSFLIFHAEIFYEKIN